MGLVIRAFALIIRIAMFYSPVAKNFSELLIIDKLPYSLNNLTESKFLRDFEMTKNSEIYFQV